MVIIPYHHSDPAIEVTIKVDSLDEIWATPELAFWFIANVVAVSLAVIALIVAVILIIKDLKD